MSIYHGSQKIKELRFGGSQKIKEAYVGSQLVFKGTSAFPENGVLFTRDGAFVSYTGITYQSAQLQWRILKKSSGLISGVIFGENTTTLTITKPSTYLRLNVFVDDEEIGQAFSDTTNIDVPSKFVDGKKHTIKLMNQLATVDNFFYAISFNV